MHLLHAAAARFECRMLLLVLVLLLLSARLLIQTRHSTSHSSNGISSSSSIGGMRYVRSMRLRRQWPNVTYMNGYSAFNVSWSVLLLVYVSESRPFRELNNYYDFIHYHTI